MKTRIKRQSLNYICDMGFVFDANVIPQFSIQNDFDLNIFGIVVCVNKVSIEKAGI